MTPLETDIPFTKSGPEKGGNFEFDWANEFIEAHVISDVGRKREHNEDSCIICAPEDDLLAEKRGVTFAVADGMGGASAGEYASQLALTTLIHRYYSRTAPTIAESLEDAISDANRRIFEKSETDPEYEGMGTTTSSVSIVGDCAYVGHVGDTRVYVLKNTGHLIQLTDDHSLVAEQMRNGILTEEEARNHTLKNLITRAVGIREHVDVDLLSFRLNKDDTILVCSDGLTGFVTDEEILETLKMVRISAAARLLIEKALESGGSDNVSVALIRATSQPPRRPMESGTRVVGCREGFLGRLIGLFSSPGA